ncbi:hypothetical protein Q1695_003698 [Nippostrongylus brasiliensis]|nr:hypothetical protein Q1695_003698 [Nippostrongylus brasiliensis]
MDNKKVLYRSALLLHYRSGRSASEAHRFLQETMEDQAPSRATCFNWYWTFENGNESLDEAPRTGRPPTEKKQQILATCDEQPNLTVRGLAALTHTPKSTVYETIRRSGKVAKMPRLLPHALTSSHKEKRVEVCTSLLNRRRTLGWIDLIVTMDEKYCVYDNTVRRKHWVNFDELPEPQPKHDHHDRKEMLSFWWDIHGPIFWELVPTGCMVDADIFCTQLEKMSEIVRNRRPKRGRVLLLMDNASPHTAKSTKKKLEELGIELLPHPPYSPDLAPSDYHVFRSMQSFLAGKKFNNRDEVKNGVESFLLSKPPEFFASGIWSLPARWQYVIDHNGEYIVE